MKTRGPDKPVVLYVGPKAFYVQAHIPGADFIGPVQPEGMEKLHARIAPLRERASGGDLLRLLPVGALP